MKTLRIFFFSVFILISLPACEAEARGKILDIQEVVSPGGLKAWLVEDHSVPVIAIKFAFKDVGSVLETDESQGLSLMLSNTMDEGAGDLDAQAFQKALDDLSITLRFSSSRDVFAGEVQTLTETKARAFELLKLSLTAPRFDEEAVERMRRANQSRIRSSLADPEWIAARIMNDTAFRGHPYARNSGGTISTLEKITPEDLRRFHKSYLGKNNLVISAAGDITAKELAQVMDSVFGALPEVKIPAPPPNVTMAGSGKTYVFKRPMPQTIVELMQPGIDKDDPDYYTAKVLDFILGSSGFGSRLMREVREKRGLTYGIYSGFSDGRLFDSFRISTSTRNESVPEVLGLVKAEMEKMKAAPVSEAELADAKSYLTGSLPLTLTSTESIAATLTTLQADDLPIDYLDKRQAAIERTTVADIQRAAKKLLTPEAMITILVGQPEIKDAIIIETVPNAE